MIPRDIAPLAARLAQQYPVLTLTGPRQSGKTTLCRELFAGKRYVTLEDPDTRRFAQEDPRGFLKGIEAGAIVDEIQRAPQLPSYLQSLVDEDASPGRFILTGSQQFELMSHVSQSLAGRTAVLRLLPFSLAEVAQIHPVPELSQTLLTGFYPRIHDRGLDPSQALGDYFATYVERDLHQLAAVHDLQRFERFVRLCAGRIGQLVNLTSLGNDAGVSHATARAWLDLLQTSYIVHVLPPWFTNTSKRLVKSPKLYFHDVGLACWLLGLRTPEQVARDPLFGSLFENFVVIEALKSRFNRGETAEMYFYRDATGNEVDLLLPSGRRFRAVEIKAGATVNSDYFRGLSGFSALFPDALEGGSVVYGGETAQMRSDWPVIAWKRLQNPPK
ncbi:ATP-binding protein [Variovorax sp. LjRoot130]|uniref:ATP-binding protein n=1 Tax=Variovorax sp. LjRoot130 TaxID=3342261 RepID=UPI003ECD7812